MISNRHRKNRLIFEEKGDRMKMEGADGSRKGSIHGQVASKAAQSFALIRIAKVLRAT
jgi:hypothetical protein